MPNNKRSKKQKSKKATVKAKTSKNNIENKSKKGTNKNKKSHPKLKLAFKIAIIIFLLLCVIGAGIVAAIFFGLFGDDFEISKDDLTVGASNTIVLDKNGNEIANLSQDEKRKTITLEEMADYLPKAYIAIEDKRFYSHSGVDLKRTGGAILGVVTGKDNGGGSTITQQLVKNITKEKARSGVAGITRKIKEWSKAIQVERMISKNQILELYLNIIFVGGDNLHGVELGALYYFNKSAKDLDLVECAFLAGSNQSPNLYNPYDTEKDRSENIKTRTLTVLKEMKDQGIIQDEEEYNAAVAKVEAGITFTKGNTNGNATYSYHTDATIKQVIKDVMEQKNISEELAKNYVYSSGLTIYSTQDSAIQETVETELKKSKYQISGREKNADGTLKNDHTQAGIVVIENATGQVAAVGGALNENQYGTGLNRGIQAKRQTGSSMKPLADIAPGLQEKVITAATVYDDVKTSFNGYTPGEWNSFLGLLNIRSSIRTSQNIPMVKIMRELTPAKSIEYLKKMGITTLTERDNSLPLAIGGLDEGITPLEMAGAYETIANDGVYTTPIFYTKVVDSEGNTVLTSTQEKTRVLSEQNAYLTRSIIQEPLKAGGTAGYCAVSGMETCAKTGSTDNYVDRWLCGMTPYYTTACWFGFDNGQEPLKYANGRVYSVDGNNPAGQIWSTVMKNIHNGLPNKTFSKPSGIVTANICKVTGCIATSSCTDTYTEMFTSDNMPTTCEGHGKQVICKDTGKVANEYCPNKEEQDYGGVIPKEKLGLWTPVSGSSKVGREKVNETCTVHKKPEEPKNTINNNTINNTSTNNTISNNTATGGNTTNNITTPNDNKNNVITNSSNTASGNNIATNTSAGNNNVVE